nr:glutamate racemase [uncultured Brumimicrobium sp.]
MHKLSPIGFFDSGYGGLTVLKEVQQLMPQYDYLYLGDNARAPYGTKSVETVYEYTWECVKTLFDKGCDLVVLACNTASAKALRKIQQFNLVNYPGKRVLGVIRPSAEIVGDFSQSNKIVVLGTEGTISSNTYIEEFSFLSPQTQVFQYACPQWVPLIESRDYENEKGKALIRKDIDNILSLYDDIDVMLLGCTHYPILQRLIEEYVPSTIQVISQGEIVAGSLASYLNRHTWMRDKLSEGKTSLYLTTGDPKEFEDMASKLLEIEVNVESIKI